MYPMPKNKKMQSILIGMMLGDSYIRITKTSKNGMMILGHSLAQKEYALHKAALLKTITDVTIKEGITKFKDKYFPQIKISSKNHPIYTKLHNIFYNKNVKVVSNEILSLLEPEGIAIWYMDDGGLILHKRRNKDGSQAIKSRELCLNTQCFTYEEQQMIVNYFSCIHSIKFNIYKNKESYRLVCGANEAKKFINMIKPFIIPNMDYKIDMQYK